MIKIYGMPSCPYCEYILQQIEGNDNFLFIDIGKDIHDMHAFLELRDHREEFKPYKEIGDVGVPCFIKEDGSITLEPKEVGLKSLSDATCGLNGKGC